MSLRLLARNLDPVITCKSQVASRHLRVPFHLHHRRRLSNTTSSTRSVLTSSRTRVSTLFTGLLFLGAATTAYGLYDFYSALPHWPPEIRADLRAGLKAKHQGDLTLASQFLRRAWETAQTLPLSNFVPEPRLKTSGIALALANVLEDAGNVQEAYNVYAEALSHVRGIPLPPPSLLPSSSPSSQISSANTSTSPLKDSNDQEPSALPTPRERMRAAAIALKLSELVSPNAENAEEEEERWLTSAVEETLKSVRSPSSQVGKVDKNGDEEQKELGLPEWARTGTGAMEIGAPLQALGEFYARTGRAEYAIPLYLQAINFLVPPSSPSSSTKTWNLSNEAVRNRCLGAQLMTALPDLILATSPPSPETLVQAEKWARQALALTGGLMDDEGICTGARIAALFGIGVIREMSSDLNDARKFFTASLEDAQRVGLKEGVLEAKVALRRVGKGGSGNEK